MGLEIDFLPVGDGQKSGDAIAFRYGNLSGPRSEQKVVVIDGGFSYTGSELAKHIRTHFQTDTIDIVFLTHPDGDHALGLATLIQEMDVRLLVMHQPWNHAPEIRDLFRDGRITDLSLEIRIRKSLEAAHALEKIAVDNGVEIIEGFGGMATPDGYIRILGPTREYYQSLLPQFRRTPEAKALAESLIRKAFSDAINWVGETLHIETLTDAGETSAENNSSLVLLLSVEGENFLFTGDAGIPALTEAADHAAQLGIDLTALKFMQVPHHGSKRNVGPTILNRIKARTAFISASSEGAPKHPSKKVINALKRRGSTVYSTQGATVCHVHNHPLRPGWGPANELPFYDQVED